MSQAVIDDLTLEYETFGDQADPAILLIMGLGSQLIQWPDSFCQNLADQGHFVIRYDNRDVGLSTKMNHLRLPNIPWAIIRHRLKLRPKLPYTLTTMANDAIGLLDYLKIEQAHLVGVSMGGMIAQLIAIHFPERTMSLTSIMSTTGNPKLPRPTPEATAALTKKTDPNAGIEEIVKNSMAAWKVIMSPGFPVSENSLKEKCLAAITRSYYPAGTARHLLASICTADRRKQLQKLTLPTLIIHGTDDPLIPIACGKDTAENIPQSEFHAIEGMAHDLPDECIPKLSELIGGLTQRSRPSAKLELS
ncbi:alpha/beta fold hydrolase [Pseudomaricurvus sp.]|uniref:alpha/beta fold hydrolase n=1 Tax=Pseudomaricurvus sp. TaxID=2004510 RepID=UPI003F6D79A6